LRDHILDRLDVDYAIANCYMAVDSMRHPDFNIALARATNDWLVTEWLDKEPRLRTSMILPSRDPAAAAREVRRIGAHPGFVQALMPVHCDRLYGNRYWYPLLEALVEHDLVFGLHLGGTSDGPSTVTGTPNYYISEYVSEVSLFAMQLLSFIAEGAFAQFPSLRVAVLEGGFAWLPAMSWRFDREWKGLRRDVPWVKAPPTELTREHVRLAIAPVDCDTRGDMESVLRWLVSDELLMFATDYPHWHDDDLSVVLGAMPEAVRTKLMADNARAWYRL
jgi:predicted TIM-barrel fold metal-dependent hydrolase